MNNLAAQVLAIIAVVVIALAVSGTSGGAKVVQTGLVVIILAVLLRNTNAYKNALNTLNSLVTSPLQASTGTAKATPGQGGQ